MQRILPRLILAVICCTTSSCGTLLSRGEGHFFGGYPLEAVVADGGMIVGCFEDDREVWMLRGLASLPFDLLLDVAFCPLDLIAWGMGHRKGRDNYRAPEPQPGTATEPPCNRSSTTSRSP